MTLIVRPAILSDFATIARFNTLLALETERRTLDPATLQAGVRALLEDPSKGRYFVAEEHGRPVGQLMITSEWSDWRNGTFWWVQSVYVAERARCHGVFKTLFGHVEMLAATEPGICGIRLYVERGNERAQEVYARVGMMNAKYLVMEIDRPTIAPGRDNGSDSDDAR